MSRMTMAAIFAAGLLASTSLSGVANAQINYSKAGNNYVPAIQQAPVVSYTQQGNTYETYGQAPQGPSYTKGAPVMQYAPVEYVQEQPTVYEAAVVPVVELVEEAASAEEELAPEENPAH